MHPDTTKDLRQIAKAVELDSSKNTVQSCLGRIENDLDRLVRALDDYGVHKPGYRCGGKKSPDTCNCGLDRARERAGLTRTFTHDGPEPRH